MPDASDYLWRGRTGRCLSNPWSLLPGRLHRSWTAGDPELSPPASCSA